MYSGCSLVLTILKPSSHSQREKIIKRVVYAFAVSFKLHLVCMILNNRESFVKQIILKIPYHVYMLFSYRKCFASAFIYS